MTSKNRTDLLTTTELYHLDHACQVISRAFGGQCPYLVGTAGVGGAGSYRDVDVRLMLGDDEFAASCPTRERWELLCLSVSAYVIFPALKGRACGSRRMAGCHERAAFGSVTHCDWGSP